MPQLNFTNSTAAGASYAPLTGWTYEFLPFPAHVRVIMNASAVGTFVAIFSGSECIQDDSPLSAGGTTGVIPNDMTTGAQVLDFQAAAGDKLRIAMRNPTGGAVVQQGTIIVQPLG
jgi:hypothetical protein